MSHQRSQTQVPELLAPAGNLEKLRIALHYGADAVYMGGRDFGLRQLADNFSLDEMAEGVELCHSRKARAYLTLNSYLHNQDMVRLPRFLDEIRHIPFDAYIVADPGVIESVRKHSPEKELHLSTQANTVNWQSAQFWQRQGIRRINLARELSLQEIAETVRQVDMEFEAFVHGAMCISYSGRCLLSSIMSDRNANQGACSHPCRWNYALVEETRPGQYFPVHEEKNGTFIFNSKDLCLLGAIPQLVRSGVHSLKIEGRMKGIYYVASVVRIYREALDRYAEDPESYAMRPEWMEELCKISHRGYTTGFLFGAPTDVDQEYRSRYIRNYDFVGKVEESCADGTILLGVRNRIEVGQSMEFIGPRMRSVPFRLDEMQLVLPGGKEEPVPAANPNSLVRLKTPYRLQVHDLLRREKTD